VVSGLADWPYAKELLEASEIVIGLRAGDDREKIHGFIDGWPGVPRAVTVFDSYAPKVSSGQVREALRHHRVEAGLLKSVERYSDHNWLYVSLA
jgi:nicotinic acid mononucleotide adenylyltransferase